MALMRRRDPQATIYALVCPLTGALRYIGQTWHVRNRQRQHGTMSDNQGRRPVNAWLRKLMGQGHKPVFVVIETTDAPDEREALAIKVARENGFDLLNLADGGQQNGHLIRGKVEALGTRGRNRAAMTLSDFVKTYGRDDPRTIRVRNAIRRGEERFGKREFHRRVNERHDARVAAVWGQG